MPHRDETNEQAKPHLQDFLPTNCQINNLDAILEMKGRQFAEAVSDVVAEDFKARTRGSWR